MKLNKIFMAVAAMAIVGCSSDDLNVVAPEQTVEDARLVELNPDFVLAGVGVEDTGTRTHWEQDATTKALQNKFLPIYNATAAAGQNLDVAAEVTEQTVGLCWLGNGAVGTDVYTNYEFYHFGWLNKGETKADLDKCGTLFNGSLYSDITNLAAVTNGVGGEALPGTDWTITELPAKSVKAGADNLNYNSGVYKTENKSIFGGQYIVYYPFDEDFKDAGTIPAKAETVFNNVSQNFNTPEVGKATFRYSSPVTIEGGDNAADFSLYNLSTLVQLRVACPAGDAAIGDNISQVILYSPSEKLLKQANLAADKIVAGQKGEALYASTEGTKTIVANFTAPVALAATNGVVTSAYITALPTTVDDLEVLVYNSTDKKWARVAMPTTAFEAGKAKRLDISVKDADFTSDYIAVDDASLLQALTDARAVATAANPATITVIGDITLTTSPFNINNVKDANITIKGDDIIVPEDITLNLKTNMESDIRVLGKSCCTGANGGIVDVQGGTISNVTMEPTEARVTPATYNALNPQVTYTAAATVAAGKTFEVQAGNVVVNAAVQHKGNIVIAEGAKVTVAATTGDLKFMGSNVTNNGTIEVNKGGKYDMTDANGNATAADGKRMTNNGKFIHNVDAGVGTAVQSMVQNGEYRCKVDDQIKLDDAFLQWTACSVIEMVNAGALPYNLGTAANIATPYKHNGKYIDIEVNSGGLTTFNNVITANPKADDEVINIGNLTVTAGGLAIDYNNNGTETPTPILHKRTLNVNGNMAVAANTTFVDSKKITVTGNLTVSGGATTLTYKGAKANVDGLAVAGDIKVSAATFDAGNAAADVDALNITCANFYLENAGTAIFGNRTDGAAKNLVVSGTISNPLGCIFKIVGANQDGNGSVLAWVTCSQLLTGGTFPGALPRVE
jgi:hypothetical protein